VTKVLLGLGFLLVVAVALVAGAVIYAPWFDSRQEVEGPIVPDEDIPNMTEEDVEALVVTHVFSCKPDSYHDVLETYSKKPPRYTGAGIWIVNFDTCVFTVNDRTGKVSP
jgi:hypothetical protein